MAKSGGLRQVTHLSNFNINLVTNYTKDNKPVKGKHKGFGFVNFEYEEHAKKAVEAIEIEWGFSVMLIEYANNPKRH